MTASHPTLLPVSTASTYTSSFDPSSPKAFSHTRQPSSPPRSRRPPSPKAYIKIRPSARPTASFYLPHAIRIIFTPRVLSPILLWAFAIYLVHRFLLPLPVPSLSIRPTRHTTASDHFLSTTFPAPPLRDGDDSLDSVDPLYRPFSPLPAPASPFPRLRPTRFLPPRCLEQWFSDGETLCGKVELGEEEKLDATWLWVNGSDERWREMMVHWREQEGVFSPEHHFREQNELVYSMRSALDALPGHLRTFHLITADYPFRPEDVSLVPESVLTSLEASFMDKIVDATEYANENRDLTGSTPPTARAPPSPSKHLLSRLTSYWRIAQTPKWLNFSRLNPRDPDHPYHPSSPRQGVKGRRTRLNAAEANYPVFRHVTHSEIFHLPSMERDGITEELGEREWKESQWRAKALPTFNSMAIESRIGWLPGLSDATLALNDDFFLLRPHAVSDFHSPLYGSVIRFDHGYLQQVRPTLDKSRFNDPGEMGGLFHANWLLSQRFPRRLRPYFAHVPKVITRGLHHEASLMFKEALFTSSQRRFREMSFGEGDIQMQWLLTSLRVERWREALLWTYCVANLGTLDVPGQWADRARKEIIDMFGLGPGDEDVIKIEVHRGIRWTLEHERMDKTFHQAGWESPKATEFLFSSMDGHLPPTLKPSADPSSNDMCFLDFDRCFGPFWSRDESMASDDMFKRLAFQYPECGDCMIMALVTSSGPLGLSAFFPSRGTTFTTAPFAHGKPYPTYRPPPHLPLSPTWHEANFSLDSVMSTTALPNETVDLREYCMKLLSRYLYLSAKSVSHFHMLKSPEHATRVFKMIQDNPLVSILGLNDNIEGGYDQVKDIMKQWFEFRWPRKAVWERDWDPVKDILH